MPSGGGSIGRRLKSASGRTTSPRRCKGSASTRILRVRVRPAAARTLADAGPHRALAGDDPFGAARRERVRAAAHAQRSAARGAAVAALVANSRRAQGLPAAAAEDQAARDRGHRAGLGRRLPLCRAGSSRSASSLLLFVHEMGHVVALRREGIKASAPMFMPFMGAVIWAARSATTRSPRRASGSPARCSAPPAPRRPSRSPASHPQPTARGARLLRLPPQPLQPAAGRAARRRARDGGDGAVDVVPRLRRAGRAAAAHAQPDPADHRAARGLRALRRWKLRKRARSSRPPTTASRRATACWSARSTSA